MFGMEIINKALDALPPGSPDHMWLSHVSEHAATTPHSVVMMAHQTALSVLGLNGGRFALPSAEPSPAGTATPPLEVFVDAEAPEGRSMVVLEKSEDGTFGTAPGSVSSTPTAADYAEPDFVFAPPVVELSGEVPDANEAAFVDTLDGGSEDEPLVVEERLAPRAYEPDSSQGLTEGIIAPPVAVPHMESPLAESLEEAAPLDEVAPPVGVAAEDLPGVHGAPLPAAVEDEFTATEEIEGSPVFIEAVADAAPPAAEDGHDSVFGSVPFEVSDALYANEENGKPTLDLVIINDEAEAAAAEEIAAAAEAALLIEAEALVAAAEYVPTPLPLIPGLPAMQTEQFIGSEPVSP